MPRRYDNADAKRRILTACVRFFLEKGYTRTTVAEIVKEADVSISTFQNVFRTKDGVLVELVKFMFGSQFDMAGQIAGQKLPPRLCVRGGNQHPAGFDRAEREPAG